MQFQQQAIKFRILDVDKNIFSLNKIFCLSFSIPFHEFLLAITNNTPF